MIYFLEQGCVRGAHRQGKATIQGLAPSDLIALRLKPCALNHSFFIIRDANKTFHFVSRVPLGNFCTSLPYSQELRADLTPLMGDPLIVGATE